MQSLGRFAVSLAGERSRRRPVAECVACGLSIYPGEEYLEIWPGMNCRNKVCSMECARWVWRALKQEDQLHGDGWHEKRIAEEVQAPWWS